MIRAPRSPYGWLVVIPFVAGASAFVAIAREENVAKPRDGTPAVAQIQKSVDGECMGRFPGHHCYALRMQVHPPNGTPFSAHIDVNLAERHAARVQPAQWVSVVIDKRDSRRVGLDVEALDSAAPAPPASASAPGR